MSLSLVLVDDDADFRFTLRELLTRDDRFAVVGEAGDGKNAIDTVAELQPDIVVLDLEMPVMDGRQAIPHLRRVSPESRIVILSASAGSRIEPFEDETEGFFEKGVPIQELSDGLADIGHKPAQKAAVGPDPKIPPGLLDALIASSQDAILVKDRSTNIQLWNPAAEKLYGYSTEEVMGRPVAILVPESRKGEERRILNEVLRGQRIAQYDTERLTKDGRIIVVSLSISPIYDVEGRIWGASVITRDITDQRIADIERDRLAAIVKSSDDAILSKDRMGIVTSWNPAAQRLYGYTIEEAVGRHVSFIVPAERKGEEQVILDRILAGQIVDHYETQRVRKDGMVVDVSLTISPIHDRKGSIVGASVIARDIAERKRMERLEQEVGRRDFLARVAHELRTPLSTIVGATQLLQEGRTDLDEETSKKLLSSLGRQGRRAQTLIRDLLELASIQSADFTVDIQQVQVSAVVASAIESFRPPEGVKVVAAVPDDLMAVADPLRLEQVLGNLLTNAYKYGGSNIEISTSRGDGRLCLDVQDDGPGVPAHIVERMFEPFARAKGGPAEGTGLGLSIARRLTEAFGGTLIYDASRSTTCFRIGLRMAPENPPS